MITLSDIYQWAAGIAESQGTATEEEEAVAAAIRDTLHSSSEKSTSALPQ